MSESTSSDGTVPQAGPSTAAPPVLAAQTLIQTDQDKRAAAMFAEFQRQQLASHVTEWSKMIHYCPHTNFEYYCSPTTTATPTVWGDCYLGTYFANQVAPATRPGPSHSCDKDPKFPNFNGDPRQLLAWISRCNEIDKSRELPDSAAIRWAD